jgi:hypothetical protein
VCYFQCDSGTCQRQCYRIAQCGQWAGGWDYNFNGFTWAGSDNRNIGYSSPIFTESSDYCYTYETETKLTISGWGTANSAKVGARLYRNSSLIQSSEECKVKSTSSYLQESTSSTLLMERGVDGRKWLARGYAIDYGNDSCDGSYPINDLEGDFEITLYVHQDEWLPEDTIYKTCNY